MPADWGAAHAMRVTASRLAGPGGAQEGPSRASAASRDWGRAGSGSTKADRSVRTDMTTPPVIGWRPLSAKTGWRFVRRREDVRADGRWEDPFPRTGRVLHAPAQDIHRGGGDQAAPIHWASNGHCRPCRTRRRQAARHRRRLLPGHQTGLVLLARRGGATRHGRRRALPRHTTVVDWRWLSTRCQRSPGTRRYQLRCGGAAGRLPSALFRRGAARPV